MTDQLRRGGSFGLYEHFAILLLMIVEFSVIALIYHFLTFLNTLILNKSILVEHI